MSRQYGIGTGLPDIPIAGTEEQKQLLMPVHRSVNALAQQLSDITGMTEIPLEDIQGLGPLEQHDKFRTRKFSFVAAADIAYGRLINLDSTALESKIGLADCTNVVNKRAHGMCIEPAGIVTGQRGRVLLFNGLVILSSGVTPGTVYYLGAAGAFLTAAPPSGSNFQQAVAIGISSTVLVVNIAL